MSVLALSSFDYVGLEQLHQIQWDVCTPTATAMINGIPLPAAFLDSIVDGCPTVLKLNDFPAFILLGSTVSDVLIAIHSYVHLVVDTTAFNRIMFVRIDMEGCLYLQMCVKQ